MGKWRNAYRFVKKKYDLLSLKKYTTIAGTLVFFLIMSIGPLSFLLTLIIGKLPIDIDKILTLPVFSSVKNILLYLRKEAENAATGVSVLLVLTTLYSSSNLFYQMRRSGEIIYDYRRKSQGWHLRLGAFVLLWIVIAVVIAFVLLFGLGTLLFSKLFSHFWETLADYLLLFALSFFLVLLLNIYICPYKEKTGSFLQGTIFTVVAWIGAVVGFSVYITVGNLGQLYGAMSAIIIFLLWLYVLMICFIVGVIINSEKIMERRKSKRRHKP